MLTRRLASIPLGLSPVDAPLGYTVILMVVMFAVAGLVVDGGAMVTAHQQADSIARQAARTAGQHLTLDPARHAAVTTAGTAAGQAYARDHGCETSSVTVAGHTITATCSIRYDPLFIPGTYLATRKATADAQNVNTP